MNKMQEVAKLLDIEIDKEFEIKEIPGTKYTLTTDGLRTNTGKKSLNLEGLLAGELEIIRINKVTKRQKEILKALYVLGLRWVAEDKSTNIYAYQGKPTKEKVYWKNHTYGVVLSIGSIEDINKLSDLVSWEDSEPLEIEKVIKED